MGYGDNEPPAIRADPIVGTLQNPSGFAMLFLTFVAWDVLKFSWIELGTGESGQLDLDSGRNSTDYLFSPVMSDGRYLFKAQGCNKAIDGSTDYCSPVSDPYHAIAPHSTNSLKQFLHNSGLTLNQPFNLLTLLHAEIPAIDVSSKISVRTIMRLN
jgi:hypothetical protein